jgi:hypothetical protein
MDACTASTIRWMFILVVIVMASTGLWSVSGQLFCRRAVVAERRKCTLKAFAAIAGVLVAGYFLTTLVIMHNDRQDTGPTTTDLMNNIA